MSTMMTEAFSTHSFVLLHGGLYRHESSQGHVVSPHDASERITRGRDSLDRIAKLFDEPRIEGESDAALVKRLASFFPGVSLD
jgi:hypothetical protein